MYLCTLFDTAHSFFQGVNNAACVFHCLCNNLRWFSTAGPIPLRVREAEIPIVSDAECIRKVNAVTEKIFILPASSFCAGGEQGNDACQVYSFYDTQEKLAMYVTSDVKLMY